MLQCIISQLFKRSEAVHNTLDRHLLALSLKGGRQSTKMQPNTISPDNRADILDWITVNIRDPAGQMSDIRFLERLIDLDTAESRSFGYSNMREELQNVSDDQENYYPGWFLADNRIALRECEDKQFLKFLCLVAHPLVQTDPDKARKYVEVFNEVLSSDGFVIEPDSPRLGGTTWRARSIAETSAHIVESHHSRASHILIKSIGLGGMGIVEEVWTPTAESAVARKRLTDFARLGEGAEENIRRFQREIELLRDELRHPNIIRVIDCDLESDDPWFTMPLAISSLDMEVPDKGMAKEDLSRIFLEVLDAIEFAHSCSIVHRDIKPHNILLFDGHGVVADFSLGRRLASNSTVLTTTSALGGTTGYVAPEQWKALHGADERSDVYALGSLLYFMSTGLDPAAFEIRWAPRDYQPLISKCRNREKEDRYQSVTELKADFVSIFSQVTTEVGTPLEVLQDLFLRLENGQRVEAQILNAYQSGIDDYRIFLTTMGKWSADLIKEFCSSSSVQFASIIDSLNVAFPSTGFSFTFLDTIAEVLLKAWNACEDLEVRRAVAKALLEMGNRWDETDLGRAFCQICKQAASMTDQILIRDVMLKLPEASQWVGQYLIAVGDGPIKYALEKSKQSRS